MSKDAIFRALAPLYASTADGAASTSSSTPAVDGERGGGASVLSHPVMGVSKHLCGVATDLSLRCLVGYVSSGRKQHHTDHSHGCEATTNFAADTSPSTLVQGIVFATCCHHMCVFDDYVNQEWWHDTCGLDRDDFNAASRASSWASLTTHDEKSRVQQALGVACKRLIDTGRVLYLQAHGFPRCHLQQYCEQKVTVENCLLVASS